MSRRFVAALLIFSWIVLSGFDLLEDLHFESGNGTYAQGTRDKSLPTHLHHRANLTNNIVESAANLQVIFPSILRWTPTPSASRRVWSFRGVSDLHKLHRVFII